MPFHDTTSEEPADGYECAVSALEAMLTLRHLENLAKEAGEPEMRANMKRVGFIESEITPVIQQAARRDIKSIEEALTQVAGCTGASSEEFLFNLGGLHGTVDDENWVDLELRVGEIYSALELKLEESDLEEREEEEGNAAEFLHTRRNGHTGRNANGSLNGRHTPSNGANGH